MLYLSLHTFSSVGYGSIYPTCAAAQWVVFVESYATLLVQGAFGGYMYALGHNACRHPPVSP